LQRVVKHDSASIALFDRPSNQRRLQALTFAQGSEVLEPHTQLLADSPAGLVFQR